MGDQIACVSGCVGFAAFLMLLFSDAPAVAYLLAAVGIVLALVSKKRGSHGYYRFGLLISVIVLVYGLGFFLFLLAAGYGILSMLG